MMRNKTYWKKVLELQNEYLKGLDQQRQEFNKRLSLEYNLAYSEISAKLRELLVDTNYELFHSSDSVLKSKVYAFMMHGLAMFHDRAYKGRPSNRELPIIKKKEDTNGTIRAN